MAKEIAYSRISTKLQNLKAAHPQDVSAKLWKETLKDVINGSEAMRLFDVFAGSLMLLEARNSKYLTWSAKANSANWTAAWLQHIFEKYSILSKFGPSTDATGKVLHPRKPKSMAAITEAPTQQPSTPEVSLEDVTFPDLMDFSDGQLNMLKLHIAAEEKRRKQETKKAELLKVFSEMAKDEGFSLEDIMGLV